MSQDGVVVSQRVAVSQRCWQCHSEGGSVTGTVVVSQRGWQCHSEGGSVTEKQINKKVLNKIYTEPELARVRF